MPSRCRSACTSAKLVGTCVKGWALVSSSESTLQVSPEQGRFLSWLVGALSVKHAIEVGVFTGYSAVCIAQVTAFHNGP